MSCSIDGINEVFQALCPDDPKDNFVVLETEQGFVFTGSFDHAGARANFPGSAESAAIKHVEQLVQKYEYEDATSLEAIFDSLCEIHNLCDTCRFHFNVVRRGSNCLPYENAVGRHGCPANPEL